MKFILSNTCYVQKILYTPHFTMKIVSLSYDFNSKWNVCKTVCNKHKSLVFIGKIIVQNMKPKKSF